MMLTQQEIAELVRLEAAAEPGPIRYRRWSGIGCYSTVAVDASVATWDFVVALFNSHAPLLAMAAKTFDLELIASRQQEMILKWTAELGEARQTNRRLNRRCQFLESKEAKTVRGVGAARNVLLEAARAVWANAVNARCALDTIQRCFHNCNKPEWLLVQRAEQAERRQLEADGDFLAAKAYALQLEAEIAAAKAEIARLNEPVRIAAIAGDRCSQNGRPIPPGTLIFMWPPSQGPADAAEDLFREMIAQANEDKAEIRRLQKMIEGLAERCAGQAELIGAQADRKPLLNPAPATMRQIQCSNCGNWFAADPLDTPLYCHGCEDYKEMKREDGQR